MKKKIIMGIILSVFTLLVVPSVSSIQLNTAIETSKSRYVEDLEKTEINRISEIINNELPQLLIGRLLRSLIGVLLMVFTTVFIAMIVYIYVSNIIVTP
jgi:hypothetical protein